MGPEQYPTAACSNLHWRIRADQKARAKSGGLAELAVYVWQVRRRDPTADEVTSQQWPKMI